jgi:hypothetical protein
LSTMDSRQHYAIRRGVIDTGFWLLSPWMPLFGLFSVPHAGLTRIPRLLI